MPKIEHVGVIGAGVMGVGVAQNLAQTRHHVVLVDVSDQVLQQARAEFQKNMRFARMFNKSPDQESVGEVLARIVFTTYGAIGLALVERGQPAWTIKLLLMSCRVMSRGVGTFMISYIISRAGRDGARLRAHFIPNGRNRTMYVTYKFGGFKEVEKDGDLIILEHDLSQIQPFPAYVQVQIVKRQ
jgi:3-hydroxyacyl-CoA dehydrogenase-like protein